MASPSLTAPPRTRLVANILTYRRPESLRALLDDLERERRRYDVEMEVRILDDHSPIEEARPVSALAKERGYSYRRARRNHGRLEHWRLVDSQLRGLRGIETDYHLFLPDDLRLVGFFFSRLLAVWEALPDATALSPVVMEGRESYSWTRFRVRPAAHGQALEVGWVDGLYLCTPELPELLQHQMHPIDPASRNCLLGSGVGGQVSRRLMRKRAHLYRVDRSLAWFPDPAASAMNPALREKSPAIALRVAPYREMDTVMCEVGGALLAVGRDCHVGKPARMGRFYEQPLLTRIQETAPSGGTWVDVGAHHGNHTVWFAKHCGAEHVVSIEPSLRNHQRLQRTIEASSLRHQVTAVRAAVHPDWSSATVNDGPPTNTGLATVEAVGPCPVVRLDALLEHEHDIRLIKVDTEGLSALVLRSAEGILDRRPVVVAEAATEPERLAVQAVLDPFGYGEPEGPYGATPCWIWAAS